jgi:hypothetical protein
MASHSRSEFKDLEPILLSDRAEGAANDVTKGGFRFDMEALTLLSELSSFGCLGEYGAGRSWFGHDRVMV